MRIWRKLKYLLPSYRRGQERDMQEELESLAGISEPWELGNVTRAAEEARAVWSWTRLEQLYGDVQYGWRTMRQSPGFTATAVLSLALGIGANTAIFSLIDALMLRWLPVRDPQELVQLKIQFPGAKGPDNSFSYPMTGALADQREIFAGVCGFSSTGYDVGSPGSLTRVSGAWFTGGCYKTFGLKPVIGRLLTQEDDQPGAPLVAVISYGYWERQFARNPGIIGQTITMGTVPVTIAGVSPPGFVGANIGSIADITMPIAAIARVNPASAGLLGGGNIWLRVLARPKSGVSISEAKARLAGAWPQIAERLIPPNLPPARKKAIVEATFEFASGGTGWSYLREIYRKPLLVLMAVVGLVLLIACANVANLLLARAAARQREIAVRLAIGAGRGRIIRQLLTESALLSSLGASMGIGLAWLGSGYLVTLLSSGPSQVAFDLTPNWRVLAFTSAVAIATGILFGLAPAFQTTAAGPTPALKEDARMSRSRSRLLSSLVSLQVALSLLLLIGAGLFVRTLQKLQSLDPGFRSEGVLLVDINGQREGYRDAALTAFYKELLDRVQQTPGVVSASISSFTPLSGGTWSEAVAPKGQPVPERDNAHFVAAGPRFFETMQTPLVSGREFTPRDEGRPNLAIVNEAFARRYFPGQNPVGQYLSATVTRPPSDLEVVGVVKDTITDDLRRAASATVYVPYFQKPHPFTTLEIRVVGPLSEASAAIRKELQPRLPSAVLEVRALTDQLGGTLVQERMMATLAGAFGVLALVLACVGLYGLQAYSVARRTKELGIRMALGAQRRRVVAMVVKGALRLVLVGVVLGLPAAWAASRWVKSMLFGLTPADPATIAGAALVLAIAALLAAYLPARRASRADPMTALRHQ
jgi:predicted permease